MSQACGIDPAFAAYFDAPKEQTDQGIAMNPSTTTTGSGHVSESTKVLIALASSLSANARLYMSHHGEPYYEALRRWSKCAVKPAMAVVKVATAEDVAKTASFTVAPVVSMARNRSMPIVVKCGGHSPGGASSIGENGLVIDLGLMRDVTVKPEEHLVIAGGGCLYGEVSEAAAKYGLACVGGSTSQVGIGGLMLHGGYGFLTGEHGLAVDNIVAVEIVTADGQVLWASKDSNQDLFWAIRGAGNRFGVVTKLVIKAHRVRETVWGGVLMYKKEQLDSLVAAINTWFSQKDAKAVAGLALGKGPDGHAGVTVLPFYNGTQTQGEASFEPLLKVRPVVQNTSEMPYCKINTLNDEPGHYADDYIRFSSANLRPPLSAAHLRSALDSLDRLFATVPTSDKSGALILLVQPDGIERQARTDMAYCWRDNHFDVGISARWNTHDQEETMLKWMREFQAHMITMGDELRLYSNHSDFDGQSSKEFGINYMKLCDLKKKWDPENVFRSL
ncbi:hypothetical protein EC973_000212 [Apophysomyces ossiformis]|uniref:FAD-binding PCMH-type domain-containing protein n=1 Tax=Apophysomyces ossiformis TaxID=679940 RepID=A0A8H7BYR8_9FUNG|nr:hypothetical protein EC973_000212 [Apophysomyces ossiformis]